MSPDAFIRMGEILRRTATLSVRPRESEPNGTTERSIALAISCPILPAPCRLLLLLRALACVAHPDAVMVNASWPYQYWSHSSENGGGLRNSRFLLVLPLVSFTSCCVSPVGTSHSAAQAKFHADEGWGGGGLD